MKKYEKSENLFVRVTPANKKFIMKYVKKEEISLANFVNDLITKLKKKELVL